MLSIANLSFSYGKQQQFGSSAYQAFVSISADAVAPLQDNTVLGVLQLVARCRGTAMDQLLLHAEEVKDIGDTLLHRHR